jgi:hypothetical protein
MPRFNQTGPVGKGPMTGRAQGKCTNYGEKSLPQKENNVNSNTKQEDEIFDGQGRGMGRGLGRGNAQGAGRGIGGGRGRGMGRQNRNHGKA